MNRFKKINIVLFHTLEMFYGNLDLNMLNNITTHINKFINKLPLEWRKNINFILFTYKKEVFYVIHRNGYIMSFYPVSIFKKILPLEISFSLLKEIIHIKSKEKNIWHLNTYYYLMFDFVVPILKFKKQKIIAHHRGGGFSRRPIALPYSIFQYIIMLPILLRLVDIIIVQNKYEYKRLIKWYKINPKKIIWIPNGVDTDIFKPLSKNEKKILREKRGFSENDFIVLYVGRIMKGKGVLKLPEIIKDLIYKYNIKNIKFVIVGDGEDKNKLIKKLKEYNVLHFVKFVGFVSDTSELVEYYNLADVMIHLNTNPNFEGSPNVVLEAQACGLPVVGFDIPGVQDSIINGKTGFLIKNKDYKDYAKKLKILYENRELCNMMKIEARKNIEKNFNINDIIEKLLNIYKSLS